MPKLTRHRRIVSGSIEWLGVWIDSDGTVTLSAQPVEIAILPPRTNPTPATTGIAATWADTAGTARAARIMIGPTTSNVIAIGDYYIWSRVTDTPEKPWVFHGQLSIV